ncbi:hypothetical protein HYPSUDRAFT_57661 [Hypholoma sublateritium FD-334 SS-4]|uniref:Uncharacterized protein n=1 Tax=Hypholoma sublateritium (strain FD-334 SS-4) TaxID=945553 RepID=A0A0D2NLH9_HYPSF|nr:hypothetical protein HYPSUDRAFT_57661 [Hypholoma sublateritium FD-334 SS-4]
MSGRVSNEDIFILVFPVSFSNASYILSNTTLNGILPGYFSPSSDPPAGGAAGFVADTTLLRARALGNTLAAIAYGFSLLLFLACVKHLRRKQMYFQERRQKWALYGYTTGVIVLGTAAFLQNTIYATVSSSFVRPERIDSLMDTLSAYGAPLPSLFIIWATDGLMFYRTVVLYQEIPKAKRYTLLSIPAVLFMVSAGRDDPGVSSLVKVGLCVVGATFTSNIALCFLIVVRLHYYQKRMEGVFGRKRGSPYRRIIVICVESCAFIVAIVLLGAVLCSISHPARRQSISALMLVSRVAQGRAVDTSIGASEGASVQTGFERLEDGNCCSPVGALPIRRICSYGHIGSYSIPYDHNRADGHADSWRAKGNCRAGEV